MTAKSAGQGAIQGGPAPTKRREVLRLKPGQEHPQPKPEPVVVQPTLVIVPKRATTPVSAGRSPGQNHRSSDPRRAMRDALRARNAELDQLFGH